MVKIRNKTTGEVKEVSPQELSQYGLSQPPAQQSVAPTTEPTSGFIDTLSKFLGGTTRYGQALGGALGLRSEATQEAEESRRKAEEMNRLLIQRGQQATDPQERERLLATSRSISENLGGLGQQQLQQARDVIGMRPGEEEMSNLAFSAKRGGQFAAEAAPAMAGATFGGGLNLFPGMAQATTGLDKVGQAVLKGGTGAGTVSALGGAGREAENWKDLIENTATSGITGLVLGSVISGGLEAGSQTIGKISKELASLVRQRSLKPERSLQKIEDISDVAEFSLEQGIKKGDWLSVRENATSLYKQADNELKKSLSGTSIGIDDVVGANQQAKSNLIDSLKFIPENLKKSPDVSKLVKANKVNNIINNLTETGSISGDDWLYLKKAGDLLSSSIQSAASKGGTQISERSANSLVNLADSTNLIRNALKQVGPEGTVDLLKIQHYSNVIRGSADAAAVDFAMAKIPTTWTIASGLGGATAGYFAGGPILGVAGGVAPWAGSAAMKSAGVQQGAYDLGKFLTSGLGQRVATSLPAQQAESAGANALLEFLRR
jgi:hypothetical protein